jgi:hypothetical protein
MLVTYKFRRYVLDKETWLKLATEQIERRAYELSQRAGFPHGHDEEFYVRAEQRLMVITPDRSPPPATPLRQLV